MVLELLIPIAWSKNNNANKYVELSYISQKMSIPSVLTCVCYDSIYNYGYEVYPIMQNSSIIAVIYLLAEILFKLSPY